MLHEQDQLYAGDEVDSRCRRTLRASELHRCYDVPKSCGPSRLAKNGRTPAPSVNGIAETVHLRSSVKTQLGMYR